MDSIRAVDGLYGLTRIVQYYKYTDGSKPDDIINIYEGLLNGESKQYLFGRGM